MVSPTRFQRVVQRFLDLSLLGHGTAPLTGPAFARGAPCTCSNPPVVVCALVGDAQPWEPSRSFSSLMLYGTLMMHGLYATSCAFPRLASSQTGHLPCTIPKYSASSKRVCRRQSRRAGDHFAVALQDHIRIKQAKGSFLCIVCADDLEKNERRRTLIQLGYTLPGGTKGEFVSNRTKCCMVAWLAESPGAQSPLEERVAGNPGRRATSGTKRLKLVAGDQKQSTDVLSSFLKISMGLKSKMQI